MNPGRLLLSVAACSLLVACASPRPQLPEVPPGKLYEGGYINIRAPGSDGWRLVGSSPQGMAFGKTGLAAGETRSALVSMFDLRPTQTPEEFVALIKEGIDKNADPKRFDAIESSMTYTEERGYPCARHHGLYRDKEAVTSPTTKDALLLEMSSLYCRHPVRVTTGFASIYSYRGRSRYAPLEQEAQDFIKGVQVPPPHPS